MSSSERASARRLLATAGMLVALAAAAGCTVQPLYGEITSATTVSGAPPVSLASVEVKPVNDRVGQEVRNHLIFLLHGGAGQPSTPAYQLDLRTRASSSRAAAVSTSRVALEPTSAVATVRGNYRLTETATGRLVSQGTRSVQAPYDLPRQEYAAGRAERDAYDRAARELAELLRMVVAQELARPTSSMVPEIVTSPEDVDALSQAPDADSLFREQQD